MQGLRFASKHAVRALAGATTSVPDGPRQRNPTYGAVVKDALVALSDVSDRICGKRLQVPIPSLLSLERHGDLSSTIASLPVDSSFPIT